MRAPARSLIGVALALGVTVVISAVIGAVVALKVARNVVTPPARRPEDVRIVGVDLHGGTIQLGRSADTTVAGRYSLWFDGGRGHARVAEIVAEDDATVTRALDSVQRGDLTTVSRARWAGWWYLTPADLDVRYREVAIATSRGSAPAWRIDPDASSDEWVIQVHGRAVTRAEGLRAAPTFLDAGRTVLLISYRNDGDAPPSDDGRYALGGDEWRDVEAAIAYAQSEGARRIVLMGWSMGGATVMQCVLRSPLAASVTGIVLESPVVDWVRVLHFQAHSAHMPKLVRDAAFAMLGSARASRWVGLDEPIDFERLDIVARSAELTIPMLILHSDDDGLVPSDGSVALAASRPDMVQLELFSVARHTKLWNYDTDRWEGAIARWLRELDSRRA